MATPHRGRGGPDLSLLLGLGLRGIVVDWGTRRRRGLLPGGARPVRRLPGGVPLGFERLRRFRGVTSRTGWGSGASEAGGRLGVGSRWTRRAYRGQS